MQCTFCGTENRAEYKFCGTCGVRLERRQMDRRARAPGVSLKCSGCGYLNEPGMKFCGMCGTRVERRVQDRRGAVDEPRVATVANAQLPSPNVAARGKTQAVATEERAEEPPAPKPRRGEPIYREEPRNGAQISGPSFLGLNSQPEGDGEYLLEDEPSRGGLRKLVLLVILAAILGLVFVQWRSSFKASPKPAPSAPAEPAASPQSTPQGSNQPQGATTNDHAQQDATKAVGEKGSGDSPAGSASAGEAKDQTAAMAAAASSPVTPAAAAEVSPDKDAAKKDDTKDAAKSADTKPSVDTKPDDARIPDYKPSAALLRAQQYIRGRGVAQNCEQGLIYLRAATEKNDPGAAIQMAALYTSGLCVKQDRVMAYRWFNSAHELQPANMWIQKNMDQLWAQMTSQERRLAGY
jgi:hypothetical protein